MLVNNSGFQLSAAAAMSNYSSSGSGYPIPNHPMYNNNNNSPNSDYDYDGILSGSSNSNNSPVLKHDTGLAVEWSVDEQQILEQGLAKHANEPNIMGYINFAALLHDKTVRDVALRCKWMDRKRRKPEDQSLGKKLKDREDKLMDSTLNNAMPSTSALQMPTYSLILSCSARHLLEENNQAFNHISANLSTLKENIDLLSRRKTNITTILNNMRDMPGIMSRMPPLHVLLNEDLATSIFPHSSLLMMMFGSLSSIHLKQEPCC